MVRGFDDRVDTAARAPLGGDGHFLGVTGCDEIVENFVGHRFVEDPFVAVAEVVVLERFEFDALLARDVADRHGPKVRQPCFGADGRKLRVDVRDHVPAIGSRIGKRFNRWCAHRITLQQRHTQCKATAASECCSIRRVLNAVFLQPILSALALSVD